MASIYKRSRDKKRKNAPYQIEYLDADGERRVARGFTDKGLTEQLAAKLENEVLLRKRGMIDPVQERLLAIKKSSILESLAAFERSLENNTPKHLKLTMTRVRRLVEACGFKTIGDLDAETIEESLKAIRAAEDLGARTYNHYLQAIDEFGKWLAATRRLPANPVAGIDRLNAETDVRHKRRALSPAEVARLIRSARESGCEVQGYTGEQRARVYLASFLTGLRRQELASITPRSFKLDDPQPILVVEAACSKHRRKDVLPMHPELVASVRVWIEGMDGDSPLFPRLDRKKTWLMVKKDLERIGIPYETHEGIADFHAAGRHSHITGLVRSGASIMEAKELARHADIRQTVKYTHIGMEDRAQALVNLPAPFASNMVDGLGIGWDSGGALGQQVSPVGMESDQTARPRNEQTPDCSGVVSSSVASCHQMATCIEVEAAGIAPASRDASAKASTCVADRLIVGLGTLFGWVAFGLALHEFRFGRKERLSRC